MSDALTIPDGTVLAGRYAIVRCVGSGGMGAVYEAHDRVLDKRVAVKALHGERATDEKTAARFIREARSASAFRHENVAESFDFGTHDGRPFMVMELLDGEPLSAALARVRTVEPAAAVAIVAPIARALGRAHAADILHRDVKPENIFLAKTPDEPDTCVPKLVDFGISKRMRVDDLRLTASAVVVGTPAYMSPEQARAAPTLTPASDQYSLALVLYELLSGALPHEGESYNELLVAKVSRPAASLAARAPWVSSALDAAVSRALSTDPAQRFASMEAFRKAIEGAIDGPLPKPAVPAVRNPHGEARALAPTEVGYAPTMDAIASVSPEQPLVSDETLLPRAVSTSAQPAVHPRSSARPALWIALPVLALAAVGVMSLRRASPAAAGVTVSAPLVQSAAPQPSIAEHSVSIRVIPSNALIVVDGAPVGRGTALLRVRHGRELALDVRADGFAPLSERRSFTMNESIERSLSPVSAPANTPAPTPSVATHAASRAPAAPQGSRRASARLGRTGILLDQDYPR